MKFVKDLSDSIRYRVVIFPQIHPARIISERFASAVKEIKEAVGVLSAAFHIYFKKNSVLFRVFLIYFFAFARSSVSLDDASWHFHQDKDKQHVLYWQFHNP
ncbi:MAG: hypothetical protein ACLUGJ_05045 [Blautia wexlerae]